MFQARLSVEHLFAFESQSSIASSLSLSFYAMPSQVCRGLVATMLAALAVTLMLSASANARQPTVPAPSLVTEELPTFTGFDEVASFTPLSDVNDYDFRALVTDELQRRKPDISSKCTDCIVPLATSACKTAWSQLMKICDNTKREDILEYCDKCKDDPSIFLLDKVLRAKVNPIDAGYQYCWWRGQCNKSSSWLSRALPWA
eukprot:TRINITY_DN25942_c0_g1_i1.p1 TRINITY_DN25942_c0_g1~~TRINITY_DN25942_c0_g1_i1.p1  ORF type:complete len:202 (+),score=13.93 TRINITY_DN25942_c0_g1_i1:95-700(+)